MKKLTQIAILIVGLIFVNACDFEFGPNPDGGDADGSQPVPWTSVTKLEIRPDTAAVGDTVFIKVSIKDSLASGTKYYWSSAAFPFMDGNYNGIDYITNTGENRVYLGPSIVPDTAFSTDTTVLRWGWNILIVNAQNSSFGKNYKIHIRKR